MKENRPNKANHVNVIVIVYVGTHIEWVKRTGGGELCRSIMCWSLSFPEEIILTDCWNFCIRIRVYIHTIKFSKMFVIKSF